MKLRSLTIVIPCYNTASTVQDVVLNAHSVAKRVSSSVEIITLDDASTDSTPAILVSLKSKIPGMRVLSHSVNKGYGETIKTLYQKATGDWIFSLPSDDQFDAAELMKLLPYTTSADMILGRRVKRSDIAKRRLQSQIYNWLLRFLFGMNLHDANTIRLMKKSVITALPLVSRSAFVDAELAIRMQQHGYTMREVPVTHKVRIDKGGSGGKFFKTILPTIIDMVRMKISLTAKR